MAKYERRLTGNFDHFLHYLHDGILGGSASASYEDGSDWQTGDLRCAVRLNLTLVGQGDTLFLSAITSGGSQAVFWKLNTVGEESFLEKVEKLVDDYQG